MKSQQPFLEVEKANPDLKMIDKITSSPKEAITKREENYSYHKNTQKSMMNYKGIRYKSVTLVGPFSETT